MRVRKRAFEILEPRRVLASLSIADISLINESEGVFSATIELSAPESLPVNFEVATSDGSAVGGEDFMAATKAATIHAGETVATVEFELLNDGIEEPFESFYLDLVNPTNATIEKGRAKVTIADESWDSIALTERPLLSEIRHFSAIDLDGDGDSDILAGSPDGRIAWYENDGLGNLTASEISAVDPIQLAAMEAVDMDGDGDLDVVSILDSAIIWYENDGQQNFSEAAALTADGPIRRSYPIDVDSDGDVDFLAEYSNKIVWFENDGPGMFTEHLIDGLSFIGAAGLFPIDVDSDGDLDLFAADNDYIAWYENDGSETYTRHEITTNARIVTTIYATDMDGDGDIDVLSGSRFHKKISWFENDGNQSFVEHEVDREAWGPRKVYATDFDADGDVDIFASTDTQDKVSWYENNGSNVFSERFVTRNVKLPLEFDVADIDGDDDLDVLAISVFTRELTWFEATPESSLPTAMATTKPMTVSAMPFFVQYDDPGGVDADDIGPNDIEIVHPDGTVSIATFTPRSRPDPGHTLLVSGTTVHAYYELDAPGGSWDSADNGTYSIRMRSTQVRDHSGRYVPAGEIGSFAISINIDPPTLPCDYVGGPGCNIDDLDALYAGTNGAPTPLTDELITMWLEDASAASNPLKSNAADVYRLGDINLDGSVDSTDLGLLLNQFGNDSGLAWGGGNLNADASVDSTDLGLLLNNFGFSSNTAATSVAVGGSLRIDSGSVSVEQKNDPARLQNELPSLDTNDDGVLTPLDALLVINQRNAGHRWAGVTDERVAEEEKDELELIDRIFAGLSGF